MVLGLAIFGNAQEPISFRSNALGGIIDDDLDLIYDPIELRFVDGIRLYTNLSNLTSSQEQLFDNISDDEFLIGVSSQNPFMKFLLHSALVRFQNSETSNSVDIDSDLDGYTDVSGNGTLIDEFTAYLDNDYDGLYDLKQIFSQEKSNFTTDDSYSFILNNTLNKWGLTLGAKLAIGDATYTGKTASSDLGSGSGVLNRVDWNDPKFSRSVTTYLIEDEYDNLIWSEDGNFLTEHQVGYTNLDVSAMLPLMGFELRGDVTLYSNQTLSNVNDNYSGQYEYFEPEISNYNNDYSETDSYNSKTDDGGSGIAFGGSIRKTFNEKNQRKNDGFWKVGISINFGSYDYINTASSQFSSIETYFDGLDTLDTDFEKTITQNLSTRDNGTKKILALAINGRFNIPLGENVHFGIGGFLNTSTTKRETDFTQSINDVIEYDYTDSDYDDSDYVKTETSQLAADRNYDVSVTSFTCPVGLEYRIGKEKNWSLRFGTIFTGTSQTINDAKQTTASEPSVTEKEYGNGDMSVNIDNNIYESTSEHTRTTSSSTVFTYGLGYNPMDNLQIDLLGVGSSDLEFDGFRVSFTMKF